MARRTDFSSPGQRRPARSVELMWAALVLVLGACGGEVSRTASGGSGGLGGGAGGGGAAGSDGGAGAGGIAGSGWTECSTPDYAFCGVPECPEGRPGCSLCVPAGAPGLYGTCAESLSPDEVYYKAADGKILVSRDAPMAAPFIVNEAPFSAGVFLAAHGQAARVAYADRGVWTGDALPTPETCDPIPGVEICGGFCGGCPIGQTCTGRSPRHPYGLCVPINASLCSLDPKVKGEACQSSELCFVFEVEPDHQPMADATGFCLAKTVCQAAALNLPGGGLCE